MQSSLYSLIGIGSREKTKIGNRIRETVSNHGSERERLHTLVLRKCVSKRDGKSFLEEMRGCKLKVAVIQFENHIQMKHGKIATFNSFPVFNSNNLTLKHCCTLNERTVVLDKVCRM